MQLQVWEWLLFAAAAYVAVLSLVGLMRRRREELVAELTQQAAEEQRQKREQALARERELEAAQPKKKAA